MSKGTDGALVSNGAPVRPQYVLTDVNVHVAGKLVAQDKLKGIVLLRPDGPLRLAYRVAGVNPTDTWSGRRVTYTQFHCTGGRLTVGLSSDQHLFSSPQTVSAEGISTTFRAPAVASLSVPLRRRPDGSCRVVFRVSPTATPALVERGSTDTRRLGVHFTSFRVTGT